jgi:glycosyltransferase involved in cell wall biosynthesis
MSKAKVLLIAWDLNPLRGSEAGVAHSYLRIYLKHFSIDVYTYDSHKSNIMKYNYGKNVTFHFIKYTYWDRLCWRLRLELVGNWLFSRRARIDIMNNNRGEYRFMHIVTPAGYYAFSRIHKTDIRYILGPINGGLKTPGNIVRISPRDWISDRIRDVTYKTITFFPGWRNYYKKARIIIVSDNMLLIKLQSITQMNGTVIFDTMVEPSLFRPSNNKKRTGDIVLLFSGRLVPMKGIGLLLNAFKECIENLQMHNLKLRIAGTGSLKSFVEKFISDNCYQDRIQILGYLDRESLIKEYQSADIFCLPTLREPGGTAILEALSCGLPVVTSDYGGPTVTVTERCGFKIPIQSGDQYIKDMVKAIHILYMDSGLRLEMGRNARERVVHEFSLENVERELIKIWSNL